jgi:hypothetical protein
LEIPSGTSMSESSEQSCPSAPEIKWMTDAEISHDDMIDLLIDQRIDLVLSQPTEPSMTCGERMVTEICDPEAFLRELDMRDYSTLVCCQS